MGLITSFVAVVIFTIAFFVTKTMARGMVKPQQQPIKYGLVMGSYISAGLALLSFLFVGTSCLVQVPAGHVGVVTRFGQTYPVPLKEGLSLINPINDVFLMNTQVQKDEENCNCETSDTQAVTIKIITNWRPDPDQMPTIYKNYGPKYAEKILPAAIKECVKAEVAKYKVIDIVAERSSIHANVQDKINKWLNNYGLSVLEVGIADIDFSEKYDAAIEAKQLQEQQALQKEYELKKTETEAKMAAAVAKGESDSRIARVQGEAEALLKMANAEAESLRIRGEAQADYYEKVARAMTPLMIQAEYLKKWDGKLPIYSLGQASPILMLPQEK